MSDNMSHAIPDDLVFPLTFRPSQSYREAPRSFGSNRSGGRRKHGGCDLYAPVGSAVLAMAKGKVISVVYRFYCSTYAIEIDHGTFIARYGEILLEPAKSLKLNSEVRAGQMIGAVGQLDCYHQSMLHIETYRGDASGSLTNRSNTPYQRRSDLIDCTPFLDKARVGISTNVDGSIAFA